jgi:hypothetical protein
MITAEHRVRYERKGSRYESDLTDAKYALIKPFLPRERSLLRRALVTWVAKPRQVANLGQHCHCAY